MQPNHYAALAIIAVLALFLAVNEWQRVAGVWKWLMGSGQEKEVTAQEAIEAAKLLARYMDAHEMPVYAKDVKGYATKIFEGTL